MTQPKTYEYAPWGPFVSKHLHYTQAVRMGARVVTSGQGGWDLSVLTSHLEASARNNTDPLAIPPNLFSTDIATEIDTAFANMDVNLRSAGVREGWAKVVKVTTYSTDLPGQHAEIVRNLRRWMPGQGSRAVWTEVGVKELGAPGMRFEVEVEAWDPEGAQGGGA